MERKLLTVMAGILLGAGCGSNPTGGTGGAVATAGTTSIGTLATAGTSSTTTTGVAGTNSGSAGSSVFVLPPVAGSSAGSTPGAAGSGGDAGTLALASAGAGGAAGDPGSVAAGSGGGAPTGAPLEPVIPMPPEPCPTLKTGQATIQGTQVTLFVGTKLEDKKGPILIYWHATGSTAAEVETIGFTAAQVKEITDQGGVVASGSTSTGKGMNTGNNVWYTDDFKIADEVVACAVAQLNIDTHRIWTAGASAGALQAGTMAIQRSSYIASSLPNSGGYTIGGYMFDSKNVPAVMTMHGAPGADVIIVDFSKQSAVLDHLITNAGGFAVDCNHGGGHVAAPADLKADGWQFLKDHPFGVSPEPYAAGLPASFPKYCKIWSKTDPIPDGAINTTM